jgi:hypothetical protein
MHDPDVVALEIRRVVTIWHREPGGHDSGEVCRHWKRQPDGTVKVVNGWRWHVRHWRIQVHLAQRIHQWLTHRCDGCGRRFGYREDRYSYMSTDKVWHDPCMSLRHVRAQLDDLTGLVLATADDNARWRANHRLEGLERVGTEEGRDG